MSIRTKWLRFTIHDDGELCWFFHMKWWIIICYKTYIIYTSILRYSCDEMYVFYSIYIYIYNVYVYACRVAFFVFVRARRKIITIASTKNDGISYQIQGRRYYFRLTEEYYAKRMYYNIQWKGQILKSRNVFYFSPAPLRVRSVRISI